MLFFGQIDLLCVSIPRALYVNCEDPTLKVLYVDCEDTTFKVLYVHCEDPTLKVLYVEGEDPTCQENRDVWDCCSSKEYRCTKENSQKAPK